MAQDYFAILVQPTSQATAEAGTNNNEPMTPLRTKQQIDSVNSSVNPLVVTQQSANSGGLWGPMDGAMIEFLGENAYLFGGWAGAPYNADWPSGAVTNLVYRSTDFGVTWAKIRNHNLTPDATHFQPTHAAAHCKHSVSGTEYIYLIGGDNNFVNSEVRRTVDGITWTLVAADGVAGWDHLVLGSAGSLGGNLYLAGGHLAPGGSVDLEPATVRNAVWRSSDNGATWTSLGNAPWAGRQCQDKLVLHDEKLWVLGGGVYSNTVGNRVYYNDVWCFDGTTWTEVLSNGLAPWAGRFYANAFSHNGWLYISRGTSAGAVNLADTWRSRDGVTWYEVDLGAGFIASHADGLGVHSGGFLAASGNYQFLNLVNTNSPTYFVTSPPVPLASAVDKLITAYVDSNLSIYDGVITEGYTEGTSPRVITPGTNDKLLQVSMPHRDGTQNPVSIIAGYSHVADNTVYIGAGGSLSERAATNVEVRLGATLTTGGSSAKLATQHNRTRAAILYENIIAGCDELAVFGTLTANTSKLTSVLCPTYLGSSLTSTHSTLIVGYTPPSQNYVFIGGGLNSYAATDVEIFVAANATTAIGTRVVKIDINKIRFDIPLELATYTTGTRPVATTLRAGACIYDTTLSKPIWSDASVWKDAAGTTV